MLRERVEQAPADVEGLLALAKVDPPGPALDLGCGIGRHALELARRRLQVAGVDRTRAFLDEAQRGAEKREYRLGHRLYSAAELSQLLQQAGFGSVGAFGDLPGAPFDQEAPRLVIVARK